jgi:hypothetical protein
MVYKETIQGSPPVLLLQAADVGGTEKSKVYAVIESQSGIPLPRFAIQRGD